MGFCCCSDMLSFEEFSKSQEVEKSLPSYEKKPILTKSEQAFYKKLCNVASDAYLVEMQVALSSIMNKISDQKYASELNRIIDFALIDRVTFMPVLLIELNDPSHNQKKRQERDAKVKALCDKAGIKIIASWTNYENTTFYIKSRIQKELYR